MKIVKKLVLMVCSIAALCGMCSSEPRTKRKIIKNIDVKEADRLIKRKKDDPDFIIIDIRTPDEFETGHIKDAVLIDYYDNFEEEIKKLDVNKTYLIYCRSGGRSGRAIKYMEEAGFTKVYNMKGGMIAWRNNGFEVVE